MRKVFLTLLSLLLMVSFAHAQDKIELMLFDYLDLTDAVSTGTREAIVAEFQQANENVELEIEYLFDEAYHNKLQAMTVAGQLPDIIFLWPGKRTGTVTSSGLIKDLRPWIEGHEDEFVDGALAAQGPNGEIYELPEQMTATHVMYTNERLLSELGLEFPKTLDELIEQGDKIREAGYIPIAMTNKAGWQMQSCLLSALIERTGGMEWYDKVIKGDGASFADPEFVNALTVIDTLSKSDMFSPGINQADYGAALTDFVNENAVYYIDGGWRAQTLSGELTEEQKEYVTFRTFPDVPYQNGRSGSTASVPGTGFGMNANLEGEKAEAAWKWIWTYAGPVGAKIRQEGGAVPSYKLPPQEDVDPLVQKLTEFIANTPAGYVLDAKMDQEGMAVLQTGIQEMMLGAKTPEQVAQEYEAWVAANDSSRK